MDIETALAADACLEPHASHARQDDVPFFAPWFPEEWSCPQQLNVIFSIGRYCGRLRSPARSAKSLEYCSVTMTGIFIILKLDQVKVIPDDLLLFLHDRSKLLRISTIKRIVSSLIKIIHC
jgi:hypothetical protein